MNCKNTASFQVARFLAKQLQKKQDLAFHLDEGKPITIPISVLFNDRDQEALDAFERLTSNSTLLAKIKEKDGEQI